MFMEQSDHKHRIDDDKGGCSPSRASPRHGQSQCQKCCDPIPEDDVDVDEDIVVMLADHEIDDENDKGDEPQPRGSRFATPPTLLTREVGFICGKTEHAHVER